MGNSSSNKPVNSTKVSLSVRNFTINSLPQKPSQWTQRIDERTWNEFINICQTSGILPDAQQRQSEYKMWQCRFWGGMALFMIGFMAGFGLGFGGGVSGNTAMWVFGIIIGVFGFFGGLALFFVSVNKYTEINKQFIADVRANLSSNLMSLNNTYNGIIRFSVTGTGKNIFKQGDNADTAVNININIEILVQSVQYIPHQAAQSIIGSQPSLHVQNPMIQQQTVQVPAAAQGQIVMIQMADGRMVPAQIQNQPQIQYQPQVSAQPQPQQQVVVLQQPYNPQNVASASSPYAPGASGAHIEPQSIPAAFVPNEPAQPAYNPNVIGSEGEEGGQDGNNPTYGYQ